MHTFKDTAGRTWTLTVSVGVIKRVRAATGVNLYELVEDHFMPLARLLSDPPKFCEVIFAMCGEEAGKLQVDEWAFADAIGGDSLRHMKNAFKEALIDFFEDGRHRAAIRTVFEKGEILGQRLLKQDEEKLAAFNPETIELAKVEEALKSLSTNSPASPTSTPAP